MNLPRPLNDTDVIAWIGALDAQFQATRLAGSFGIRWHYAENGQIHIVELEAPKSKIVYDLTKSGK